MEKLVGSKWWKIDFHSHTPASKDYGEKTITPEIWLLSYMKAEIDGVVITDHNSGSWIDKLKKALERLKQEKTFGYREIILIPGVEITIPNGSHLLAAFPESFTSEDLTLFLGKIGFGSQDLGDSEKFSDKSINEIVKEVRELKGICIPAHVDESKGLFETCKGGELKSILEIEEILAVEIKKTDEKKPQVYLESDKKWNEVSGSDSHHLSGIEGQSYPGSHFTWIKMDNPSFEGIKLALFDGNSAIKKQNENNPNSYSSLFIEEIEIFKTVFLGTDKRESYKFSPWLNSIIGGRGSGKSSLIEFIRKIMSKNDEIPEALKSEYKKYSTKYHSKNNKEGLLTADTELSIIYNKNGIRYKIIFNGNEERKVKKESEPNIWNDELLELSSRFPVNIYSQKEIFELAKDADSLIKRIDASDEVQYSLYKDKDRELKAAFQMNQIRIREIQIKINQENIIETKISDVEEKIKAFETAETKTLFLEHQQSIQQDILISEFNKEVLSKIEKIKYETLKIEELKIEKSSFSSEEIEELTIYEKKILDLKDKIFEKVEEFYKVIRAFDDSSSIIKKINNKKTDFSELEKSFNERGIDINGYKELLDEKKLLMKKREELKEDKAEISKLKKKNEELLEKIEKNRSDLTTRRKNFLRSVLSGNNDIKMQILEYRNINLIEKELREILGVPNTFDSEIRIDKPQKKGIVWEIIKSSNVLEKCKEIKERIINIKYGNSEDFSWMTDVRFASTIKGLKEEDIDKLLFWIPEDGLKIQYKNKEGIFKEINSGSPGQKTAALLSFILSYGKEPLILDQPEDDLDNKLITDLIVSQLKIKKMNRQIILVTHNANIVVNGDSENIIVLGEEERNNGGLQNKDIRKKICEIMEGGNKAFEERYKRINIEDI